MIQRVLPNGTSTYGNVRYKMYTTRFQRPPNLQHALSRPHQRGRERTLCRVRSIYIPLMLVASPRPLPLETQENVETAKPE